MKLDRFNNTKRNSIWGIISKFIDLLLPFVTKTIIIKKLGIEYLGLNGLFTSVLTVLNLTELGIGSAIVFSMYKPLADEDKTKICQLMNVYKKIYTVIGFIVLFIGLAIMPFLPNLISSDIPKDINIYLLYLIYLSNAVISYWLFAYKNCLIQVHQRNDITSKITIILNMILNFIQIIVLLLFRNYYVYVIFIPIFSILLNVITAYYSTKLYPQYKCQGNISAEEKKEMKKRVSGLMLTKIAYASRNSFDNIIISVFLGLEMVAMYSNYYYISSSLSAIIVILTTAMAAGIGNSLVTESKEKNIKDLSIISFVYLILSGFCFSCLLSLYQPFISLWVGEELLFPTSIMMLFSVYFLVEKSLNVIGQYYDAAGLWWHGKWKGLIESIANLLLNIILCYYFGVFGVILATILTIIFIGFPLTVYYVFKNLFDESAKKYILSEYLYIIIIIIIGIIVFTVCNLLPFGTTLLLRILLFIARGIIACVLTALIYSIVFTRLNICKESFDWLKSHIKIKERRK